PDRPDGNLIDIRRKSAAVNPHALAGAHAQPAGPFAGGIIRVMDRQPAVPGQCAHKVECVTGMLLHNQIEAPHRKSDGLSVATYTKSFGVERARHLTVTSQPFGSLAAGQ